MTKFTELNQELHDYQQRVAPPAATPPAAAPVPADG